MPERRTNNGIIYRSDTDKIERIRSFVADDLQYEERAGNPVFTGHAVVFGEEAVIADFFRERFAAGAFAKTIQETDQVMLWDHDRSKPMARRSAGTLILREDSKGLYFEATPGKQSWALDAIESIKRGDVKGVSFGFIPIKEKWDRAQTPKELDRVTVLEAKLIEISPTSRPNYQGTDIQVVSRAIIVNAIKSGQLDRNLSDFDATGEPETNHSEQGRTEPDGIHSAAGIESLRMKMLLHRQREQELKIRGA